MLSLYPSSNECTHITLIQQCTHIIFHPALCFHRTPSSIVLTLHSSSFMLSPYTVQQCTHITLHPTMYPHQPAMYSHHTPSGFVLSPYPIHQCTYIILHEQCIILHSAVYFHHTLLRVHTASYSIQLCIRHHPAMYLHHTPSSSNLD